MIQLVTGADPEVISYTKLQEIDPKKRLNLNEINFRMAFYVANSYDYLPRMDERYVRFRLTTYETVMG